jgi:hypothetical protein
MLSERRARRLRIKSSQTSDNIDRLRALLVLRTKDLRLKGGLSADGKESGGR